MKKYARVDNGTVVEIVFADEPIADLYHPDIAATFIEARDPVDIGWKYSGTEFTEPPPIGLGVLKAGKVAQVNNLLLARLATGYVLPGGFHIAISDEVERRLTSMGTTAGFAVLGITSWPEDYRRGWITEENIRYALPEPADGLALATAVGAYTAALIQHARDLKDAALTAQDAAALDAIDIEAGWPQGAAP